MDFEQVADGYCLIEAPRWDGSSLWFTDILLGGFRRLNADGSVDGWMTGRTTIGGLALNRDGAVIVSGTGGIVWHDPKTGASGVLIDALEGEPISGVNDMFPDGKGGLFLGTVDHLSMLSGKEFYGKSALWRLSPDGSADLFQDGIGFANGIGLSPAGECVYVVDSAAGVIAIELRADGRPGKTAMHCALAGIDGITVDAAGNIWAALIMSGEVARIAPDGRVSERIAVPGGHPVAVCFGGPALADLYVTTAAPGAGEAALDRSLVPDVARSAGIYRLANAGHGLPLARSGFSLA